MKSLQTYLTFLGNCEDAFNFYAKVFEAEIQHMSKFKDMPPSDEFKLTEDDMEKVMHVSLDLGNGMILMGSDSGGEWAPQVKIGNNFSLSINTDSAEEADKLFARISEGGTVTMPLADTFWGDYFGMVKDKFDINWMFSFSRGQKPDFG